LSIFRFILSFFFALSLQLCCRAFLPVEFGTFRSLSLYPEYLPVSFASWAAILSLPKSLVSGNLNFDHLHFYREIETFFISEVTALQDQAKQRSPTTAINDHRVELDAGFFVFVVVAVSLVSGFRYFTRMTSGGDVPHRKTRPSVAASLLSVLLLCAACLNGVSADVSVTVNPSTGADSSSCNMTSPCRTIAYAVQSRHANVVFLSAGTFVESSVAINGSIPFVNITGLPGGTVFDCRLGA
jgi:hypothetical protein